MRIGVFGGTFDPPHVGHLILAEEACSQLGLEQIFWVLTPYPPHKVDISITPLKQRLELLISAIQNNPIFLISRVEIERQEPHYAVDTMILLREMHPEAEFAYLMGGDSLKDLPSWHRPEAFVAACNELGVMKRPGSSIDINSLDVKVPGVLKKVRWIKAPRLEISSSEIRQRIATGRPFRYFLPGDVYRLILKRNLYQNRS